MTITVNNASLFFKDHSGNVGKVKSFTDNDIAKIATAIETVGTHTTQLANLDVKVTTNAGNITTNTTDIAALSSRVDKIVDGSGDLTKATTSAYGTVVLATEADVKAGTAGKVVTADVLSAVGPTSDCVTLSGEQTITGAKTFSIITKSATPSASASGTEVVTAAWTRSYTENKWQDVATEHNNIYRGANLLNGHFSSISDVISAISKGDFSDIYVGDYIPASYTVDSSTVSTNFRIAGINTLKSRGGTWGTQNPNVCIVPDQLGTSCMNDSNTTAGGYVGSKMYTTILPKYYKALAGSASCPFYGHILTTTERLTNSVDTSKTCESYSGNYGVANGAADYANQNLILMSEVEVYGCKHWSSCEWDDESMCVQLPLFRLKPEIITLNSTCWFWLRSVHYSAAFCRSSGVLLADGAGASIVGGVRPRFFIG